MFTLNKIYRRSEIHDKYGGSRRSGIVTLGNKLPYIFIFSGSTGKKHGYEDAWESPNVFSYIGEGQSGDMKFTRGNLALTNHIANNKQVFLFEFVRKGEWKYTAELELIDFDFGDILDTKGRLRKGIRFFFKRKGSKVPNIPSKPSIKIPRIPDNNPDIPGPTERKGLVTSRVGQGIYRKRILYRWENKCAVTGFNNLKILIASHIVPWKDATDIERHDINNGILLSPIYDALFDKHLISFENSGKIMLSDSISADEYSKIGITGGERIKGLRPDNYPYLERHRQRFNG